MYLTSSKYTPLIAKVTFLISIILLYSILARNTIIYLDTSAKNPLYTLLLISM